MATITPVEAKVTRTGAGNSSNLSISAAALATTDWTLCIEVQAMNDQNLARIGFFDSVDAFTNKIAGPQFSFSGKIVPEQSKRFYVTKKDFPGLRFGTASAVLRVELAALTGGSSQSITYQAWLEY